MKEKYHIPLTKRGESGSSHDNFLYQKGNIYVMDNHRLALWCWFQEMKKGERYNLFHIDAHPDLNESALKFFDHDLWTMSLEEYRTAWQADINMPLFRWDNYLEVFLQKYPDLVGLTISATHHVGSKKVLKEDLGPFYLIKRLDDIFSGNKYFNDSPWIVNLDLDYFFSAQPHKLQLFSNEFIQEVSELLKKGLRSGSIAVLTVALSPECCGSWERAEELLRKLSSIEISNALN